ncbi:hypothetical protein FA13DRAFT_1624844, partial [Coprinellus micaceus]
RVPDAQTNNRAEIYAVWHVLRVCNTRQSLNSDSEYVINMLTEWAPERDGMGWRGVNGGAFMGMMSLL